MTGRTDVDLVVAPHERLSWPRTIGIGAQHAVAMFGATFLVPVLAATASHGTGSALGGLVAACPR